MEYGMKTQVIRILALTVFLWLFLCTDVQAEELLYFDEMGNLCMTTHDRIATNNIRYKTIGWTIKRYNAPIGDGNNSVVVMLEDTQEPQVDPMDENYQYCYFMCDKQTIFDRIGSASAEWQQELYQNGGTVYLDAVMVVMENGVPGGCLLSGGDTFEGEVYWTYEGISNARSWADPVVLQTHFNKQVSFPANPGMLYAGCPYVVQLYECFDTGAEFWPLNRYGFDQSGMIGVGEMLHVVPANLSGYYYEYVSAHVQIWHIDGTCEDYWTEEPPPQIVNADSARLSSVSVILYYKRQERLEYKTDKYNMQDGKVLTNGAFRVGAGVKENESFDVSQSVPSGENLFVDGKINAVAYEVQYVRHFGMKTCPVNIVTIYNCQWTDPALGRQSQELILPELYYVDRSYSYWEIRSIKVYTCNGVRIQNYSFEGEEECLDSGYNPYIIIEQYPEHVRMDGTGEYWLDGGILEGGNEPPPYPIGIRQNEANEHAGWLLVKNDVFAIDDTVFLAGNELRSLTGDPQTGVEIQQLALYEKDILIPEEKRNGKDYPSTAQGIYRQYGGEGQQILDIGGVNAVSLHTPVICNMYVTDESQFNQLYKPNEHCKSLILGRTFHVAISSKGNHREWKGYGRRDYSCYVRRYEVQCPFTVYVGNKCYEAGEWIPYTGEMEFYLPTGVKEGCYKIRTRASALNYKADDKEEEHANLGMQAYAAYDTMDVQVCGRLYGMQITNIERNCWEEIFRDAEYYYTAGLNNLNGVKVKNDINKTFPILRGGNPYEPDEEGEPVGTAFSYTIQTIGDYKEEDGVYIEPEFYVTDCNGENRTRVDVYAFGENGWENIENQQQSAARTLVEGQRRNVGDTYRNVKDEKMALESMQVWTGRFCLPDELYVVLYGTDVNNYIQEMGHVDLTDEIFIRKGYLMVHFNICSVKDSMWHLSYANTINANRGYANMWKIEGVKNVKERADGSNFAMKRGDVFLYNLERNLSDGSEVVGTH